MKKDIYSHSRGEIPALVRNEALKVLLSLETIEDFVQSYQMESCHSLFITKPQKSYRKPGSYFADRKHIQKVEAKPEDALGALFTQFKLQAESLGIEISSPEYSSELLAKMPVFVSSLQEELECELHVEQEQELEAELEMELELEQQQEVEEEQAPTKTTVLYPLRLHSTKKTSVANKIHPSYNRALFVSEAFLPYEVCQNVSKFKRLPFDRSMYAIGEVIIRLNSHQRVTVVIDDPLYDYDARAGKCFTYDIRTNTVTSSINKKGDLFLKSKAFHHLIAQVKFLDGRTSGYTPHELKELKRWLEN